MNKETKFLIEEAVRGTKEKVFEDISALRKAINSYQENLALLKSYAESIGFTENDVLEVPGINVSIKEIEEGKDKAMNGDIFWCSGLSRLGYERWEAKQGEVDENL